MEVIITIVLILLFFTVLSIEGTIRKLHKTNAEILEKLKNGGDR
jgi:hypothetical protein